ncbi:hypothetical protein PybrP1_006722 [[Pythium] brassicae (nom. inval.)]|nr:hypothetical protein PybrP1_006722 [[Pythium] brassicae (nom. inval.)]
MTGNLRDVMATTFKDHAQPRTSSTREWRWEDDDFTRDIVEQLQRGEALETRAFLRPIFRWMKHGVHKNGARDAAMIEAAFAFVAWMVQLSTAGDAARGLAAMPELQPSYALNTIVTASQRAGSRVDAERAFRLLLAHGYEPDVFTYTALIDVMSRTGDVSAAMEMYAHMRTTKSRPNIVTFTTLIRAVGFSCTAAPLECLRFLQDARQEERFDESLFWEALDACAQRRSVEAAGAVLRELAGCEGSVARDSERVVRALTQVLREHERAEQDRVLEQWFAVLLVTAEERSRVLSADVSASASAARAAAKMGGFLGEQTSDSVRLAVIEHDITRLAERLRDGVAVSTNDFETLIHQCRKRKWKEGVALTLTAMRRMAETGWAFEASDPGPIDSGDANTSDGSSSTGGTDGSVDSVAVTGRSAAATTNASHPGRQSVPPQPHLRATSKTYVSIVDAYMVCGDEQMAWEAVLEVSQDPALAREPALYRKFIRGAYLLTECAHIAELLAFARADDVALTHRACVELARMHGHVHEEGVRTILERLPPSGVTHERQQALLEELVMSCGFKHNATGVEATLRTMLARGFQRSALTENGVLICCLQQADVAGATATLRHFQRLGLALVVPTYDSLLREMYFKYTRRGGEFDDASRKLALRTLVSRRALLTKLFAEADALAGWRAASGSSDDDSDGGDSDNDQSAASEHSPSATRDVLARVATPSLAHHQRVLTYWCEREVLECAALMFAQHAIELIATIRDKATKAAAQAAVYAALRRTRDPFLFNLRAVASLPLLDLTFRSVGKVAKHMLHVFRDNGVAVAVQAHHAAFCVAQLPRLTVHIFKELDDVVALHASHRAEVLAFCYDALESDNLDKTVGYVVNKAGLYTLATAAYLAPKLAELYVLQEQLTVLQFFKPEVADSAAMRRLFLREVIEVETIADEEAEEAEEVAEDSDSGAQEPHSGDKKPSNDDDQRGDEASGDRKARVVEERTRRRFRLTIKAIVEFKLQHEDEFLPYMLHRPSRRIRTDEELAAAEDPQKEFLRLPLDDSHVVVVDNDDAVALAHEVLMGDGIDALGLDAEWRPDGGSGFVPSKCSILQVACETHVFLFDLLELSLSDVEDLFAHVFSSKAIVKIGFGLDGDIKRLRWSFPDARCFDAFVNVLDFSLDDTSNGTDPRLEEGVFDIAKLKHRRRRSRGLAAYVLDVLGLPLSKAQQRSDWERRPLTPRQIAYAALDAYCLIMLRRALQPAAHEWSERQDAI